MSFESFKRPLKCRKLSPSENQITSDTMDRQPSEKWDPVLSTWEEKLLAEVFRVSLHPKIASALEVRFLEGLVMEIKASNEACSLASPGFFDRVLLATAPLCDGDPSSYMLEVYGNAVQAGKNFSSSEQKVVERAQALQVARQALVSYLVLTCQDPTMWCTSDQNPPPQPFAGFINMLKGGRLQPGLMEHLLDHLSENEELESFFEPVFQILLDEVKSNLEEASGMRNVQAILPTINAVGLLTANKRLCPILVGSSCWDNDHINNGQALQMQSFLGPIFSLEPSRSCYKRTGFPESEDLIARVGEWGREEDGAEQPPQSERKELGDTLKTAHSQFQTVHMAVHQVLRNLLKEKSSQEATLKWLGKVVALNTDRTKAGVQHGLSEAATSSPGFLYNVASVLLIMCEPFLNLADPKAQKMMGKIDVEYFLDNRRFSIKEETRLAMSPADCNEEGEAVVGSDRWLDQRNLARIQQFQQRQEALVQSAVNKSDADKQSDAASSGPKQYGTITEYFALTSRALYVGPLQTIHQVKKNDQKMKDLQRHKKHLKEMLEHQQNNVYRQAQIRETLSKLQAEIDEAILLRLNAQMMLMQPDFVQPCLQFLRLQARVLLREVCPVTVGAEVGSPLRVALPLASPPPAVYAALPAQMVELIPDFLAFVGFTCPANPRTGSNMLVDATPLELQDFLTFIVSFVGSGVHLRNPYLRAKLVESLQTLCPQTYIRDEKKLHDLFETHSLAMDHLAPLLLRFFVDIEFTGSHTQFYDKFNYRSITSRLLKYLWYLPAYQDSMIRYSQDKDSFVRFANMMVNDSIYHMDESLKHLTEIKDRETQMSNSSEWESKTDEERQEVERLYESASQQVRYSLREANQLLQMMNYMSEKIIAPFMVEEMINRIAEMLNYFLDYLVGPKSLQLKVKNMEKLDWKPVEVLLMLVGVYCNFSNHEPFAEAVARDIRSYNRKHFLKAIEILQRPQIQGSYSVSPLLISGFKTFVDRAEECWVEFAQEDEELGDDIPEEYLCPISCELMKDPVTLPSSGVVCDRPSISRSLLSDEIDPFNRTYLTINDVKPNTKLKEEIQKWKEVKRATKKAEFAVDNEKIQPSNRNDANHCQVGSEDSQQQNEVALTDKQSTLEEKKKEAPRSSAEENSEQDEINPPTVQASGIDADDDDLLQQAILMSLSSQKET